MSKTDFWSTKSDLLLITLPWWDNHLPPCAPAVLKGIAKSHGFKISTYDSNIDLMCEICHNDIDLYNQLFVYFILPNEQFRHQALIDKFYDHVIEKIQSADTRFVGISVFSVYTHRATLELLQRLRPRLSTPIVLGGRGLNTRPHLSVIENLKKSATLFNFSEICKQMKLADHFIIGDGEDAVIDLLQENFKEISDTNHTATKKDLDYPFSDFDDMELEKYLGVGEIKQLPVISSKGCVRSCDFCDVAAHMARFQSKNGTRLAEEIIYLADRYKINEFAMADSIINGNMKSLREMCAKLAEYNALVQDDKKVTWSGNWISRPPNSIKPDFYDLLAAAGCRSFAVGAEHGSNHVLQMMRKKTNVDGVYFDLEQFDRVGIKARINIIVGHWSEKFDHFIELFNFLVRIGRYIANGTVMNFNVTNFASLDNTPAVDHIHLTGLVRAEDNFTLSWYTPKNPESTIKIRLARWLIILKLMHRFGLSRRDDWVQLSTLSETIKKSADQWEKFFQQNIDPQTYRTCQQSLDFMTGYKHHIQEISGQFFPSTPLFLRVNASHYRGSPRLYIRYNGSILYEQYLNEGPTDIQIDLVNQFDQQSVLEIGMTGKNLDDTQINENGDIIKDKCIMLEELKIDTIDLIKDPDFFYQQIEYEENSIRSNKNKPGWFINDSLMRFRFHAPFWQNYLTEKNTTSWFIDHKQSEQITDLIENIKTQIFGLKY